MIIISLEGLDKAGKWSQSELLKEYLEDQGYKVIKSEFHRYDTPTGELIMKFLRKEWDVDQKTIELIMAADKQAQQNWFQELEQQGVDYLILDRYLASHQAYAVANGVDLDWILQLQKYSRKPDIEIYIDIDPEESMRRKGKHNNGQNDRYESNLRLLTKVREFYWRRRSESFGYESEWIFVDGKRSIEEIHQEIVQKLHRCSLCEKIVPTYQMVDVRSYQLGDDSVEILAVSRHCKYCHSEIFDPELAKRNEEKAFNQCRIQIT